MLRTRPALTTLDPATGERSGPLGGLLGATAQFARFHQRVDHDRDARVRRRPLAVLRHAFEGQAKQWLEGDFNYDGIVDLDDFTSALPQLRLARG
jgi:hypothetical protein